jgi:hypothetical protein
VKITAVFRPFHDHAMMKSRTNRPLALVGLLVGLAITAPLARTQDPSPEEVRAIAKEAYIYAYPMVDSYRIQHAYFVDRANPEYKSAFNELHNVPRVFTPEDKAVQTPNSDTPYSFLGLDLRAEPIVITLPEVEEGRYFSVQLIDAYTHNFAYLGSRATGNHVGSFLLAGPRWQGEKPDGIKEVVRTETELAFALFRTQLFAPADLGNVTKIQAGYKVEPLSAFLGQAAPAAVPAIDFPEPLTPEEQKSSLEVFPLVNFVLGFCPTDPSETELMERFAKIGIGAGKTLNTAALTPEMRQAYAAGIGDAWKEFQGLLAEVTAGKVASGDVFGTRAYLKNNYLYRMAGAVLGIYGNSKDEAMYPAYRADAAGQPLDGSKRYTLHFQAEELPPVNAFWSVTMYDLPASLLVSNPLNRYLINSPMLPDLKRDADGGLTLYIQHESPGPDKEANWLPAPQGSFWCAMRLYWPKPAALDGSWKQPGLKIAE